MVKLPVSAKVLLLASAAIVCGSRVSRAQENPCDPRTYGAVGDGATDNTTAIQTAINQCAANGGGIVPLVDGGKYISGPISLKSHILLQIMAPTILKNTLNHYAYQPAFIGYPFQFSNDPGVTGAGPSLPGKPEAFIS